MHTDKVHKKEARLCRAKWKLLVKTTMQNCLPRKISLILGKDDFFCCFQMRSPSVKQDWVVELRLARLVRSLFFSFTSLINPFNYFVSNHLFSSLAFLFRISFLSKNVLFGPSYKSSSFSGLSFTLSLVSFLYISFICLRFLSCSRFMKTFQFRFSDFFLFFSSVKFPVFFILLSEFSCMLTGNTSFHNISYFLLRGQFLRSFFGCLSF